MTVLRVRLMAAATGALLCVSALMSCDSGQQVDGSGRPAPVLPPRPMSVSADRISPCSMLSLDQAKALTLVRSKSGSGTVNGLPSPGCIWRGTEVDVNVQFIPAAAQTAATAPGAMIVQVNGFGGVQDIPDFPGPPICQIAVDVADNQTIRVQASFLPDRPPDNADLCRRAADATSKVMTTVVAMTPR